MRARSLVTLVAVAVVATGACRRHDATPATDEPTTVEHVDLDPQEAAPGDDVKNSGRTISGVYALTSPAPPDLAIRLTLAADNTFARTRTLPSGPRADSGSYVLDDAGNLVLYVEKVGDARLSWAQRTTFALSGDPASGLTLAAPDGHTLALTRAGDAPASASGGAPAD